MILRRKSKVVKVGEVPIGGGFPVVVQSMTNTDTRDVEATVEQIKAVAAHGCGIIRAAVVDSAAAKAIYEIKKRINIPLAADIHFDHKLALAAIDSGADKIRINPSNIGDREKVRLVAKACGEKSIPIRVGVNGGSLEKEILHKYGGVTPEGMAESAMNNVKMLNDFDFDDIIISIKASDVSKTIEAYRILAGRTDHPLHVGVTETGSADLGVIKSAVGIGALLNDGIGDTIRVSLTDHPIREVEVGRNILKALGLLKDGVEIISCPTCGRCRYDLIRVVKEVEGGLLHIREPIKVAVMGCVVNGPGEAREADYGVAGGETHGVLFKRGNVVGKIPASEIAPRLLNMIYEDLNYAEK